MKAFGSIILCESIFIVMDLLNINGLGYQYSALTKPFYFKNPPILPEALE